MWRQSVAYALVYVEEDGGDDGAGEGEGGGYVADEMGRVLQFVHQATAVP